VFRPFQVLLPVHETVSQHYDSCSQFHLDKVVEMLGFHLRLLPWDIAEIVIMWQVFQAVSLVPFPRHLTLVLSLIHFGEMLLYFLFHLMEFSFCHSPTCIFFNIMNFISSTINSKRTTIAA
jgi:hypothetical protein